MQHTAGRKILPNPILLQSEELHKYILDTRNKRVPTRTRATQGAEGCSEKLPNAFLGTAPDAGQLLAMLLKLVNAKKTIEVGVFTGYSRLLTALTIPDDGTILAMDRDRKTYEIGLPIIKKAGVEHKIDYIESPALPILDNLVGDPKNEGHFDFAFVDADKQNYWNYHERLMKLIKIGGIVVYGNTLWGGAVALPEEAVPEAKRDGKQCTIEFTKSVAADPRVEISHASVGDGIIFCRRIC